MNKIINNPQICITGLGMITSVGHDVKTACASIRANIRRSTKLRNYYVPSKQGYDDYDDGLVTTHPVLPGNPDDIELRLLSLLYPALKNLYQNTETDKFLIDNAPVYLSLPKKKRVEIDKQEFKDFLSIKKLIIFNQGKMGMVTALAQAIEAINNNEHQHAIIAGVDSQIGHDDLDRFNKAKRLKTELNPEGLSPGEAASVILIEKISTAKKGQAVINKVSLNTTLENVVSTMIQDKKGTIEPDTIISDINGEQQRAKEFGDLYSTVFNKIHGEKNIECPAENIGDTGAAYAGVAMCMIVRAMARCYISKAKKYGNGLLLASSSETKGGVYIIPYEQKPTT